MFGRKVRVSLPLPQLPHLTSPGGTSSFSEDLYHLGDDFRGVIPTANLRTGSKPPPSWNLMVN